MMKKNNNIWHENNNITFLEEWKIIGDWEMIEKHWILYNNDQKRDVKFRIRLYSGIELKETLRYIGFKNIRLFGNFKGDPYDVNAKRLIAIAEK